MIKRIRIFLAAIALTVAGGITQAQAADHPAQKMVVNAITAMLDVLKNDGDRMKADPDYLQAKVDELIVPHLDFDTMTKLAVGKFWRRADAAQQTELVKEFKTLLLNTYTGALTEYSGETITFEPFRPEEREDRAVVRSTFSQSGGSDVPVIYKLREKNGWTIYDIEVNAISLVTSYRTAFTNEIDKGGIDGLLATLKERNASS
ncbi:MlaC/ttg2D family ABC transporter substrate-binding protein [Granulosicoccus sp. 3-233]|uniref:MlaC/ttg2D family ABC transporter substrate-binding protein n=1 Tax=Granulosicoccus sp. 3-233 TaxID=3417969 RepID=UPI003D348012